MSGARSGLLDMAAAVHAGSVRVVLDGDQLSPRAPLQATQREELPAVRQGGSPDPVDTEECGGSANGSAAGGAGRSQLRPAKADGDGGVLQQASAPGAACVSEEACAPGRGAKEAAAEGEAAAADAGAAGEDVATVDVDSATTAGTEAEPPTADPRPHPSLSPSPATPAARDEAEGEGTEADAAAGGEPVSAMVAELVAEKVASGALVEAGGGVVVSPGSAPADAHLAKPQPLHAVVPLVAGDGAGDAAGGPAVSPPAPGPRAVAEASRRKGPPRRLSQGQASPSPKVSPMMSPAHSPPALSSSSPVSQFADREAAGSPTGGPLLTVLEIMVATRMATTGEDRTLDDARSVASVALSADHGVELPLAQFEGVSRTTIARVRAHRSTSIERPPRPLSAGMARSRSSRGPTRSRLALRIAEQRQHGSHGHLVGLAAAPDQRGARHQHPRTSPGDSVGENSQDSQPCLSPLGGATETEIRRTNSAVARLRADSSKGRGGTPRRKSARRNIEVVLTGADKAASSSKKAAASVRERHSGKSGNSGDAALADSASSGGGCCAIM